MLTLTTQHINKIQTLLIEADKNSNPMDKAENNYKELFNLTKKFAGKDVFFKLDQGGDGKNKSFFGYVRSNLDYIFSTATKESTFYQVDSINDKVKTLFFPGGTKFTKLSMRALSSSEKAQLNKILEGNNISQCRNVDDEELKFDIDSDDSSQYSSSAAGSQKSN